MPAQHQGPGFKQGQVIEPLDTNLEIFILMRTALLEPGVVCFTGFILCVFWWSRGIMHFFFDWPEGNFLLQYQEWPQCSAYAGL